MAKKIFFSYLPIQKIQCRGTANKQFFKNGLTVLDTMQNVTDGLRPKPIYPLNFFEVGGIKTNFNQYIVTHDHAANQFSALLGLNIFLSLIPMLPHAWLRVELLKNSQIWPFGEIRSGQICPWNSWETLLNSKSWQICYYKDFLNLPGIFLICAPSTIYRNNFVLTDTGLTHRARLSVWSGL